MQSTTTLSIRRRLPVPALVLCALFGATACSSTSSSERASAASESMAAFNLSTVEVRDGIDATLESLNTLLASSGDSVKPSFEAYQAQLAALESRADVVRTEAASMKERGDEYFADWDAGESAIGEERHEQLELAYATIKQSLTSAGAGFDPFLASLKDVSSFLSLDLSPDGLAGAAPLAVTASEQGGEVKGSLEAVLREVNSVRGMISASMDR